jgi:hypothetical protein
MSAHKIHEFKKSLSKGKRAEAEFLELFKDKVEQLDGFMSDFRVLTDGTGLELKTDFYDPSKTANYFIEAFSYSDVRGGPWQALDKGSKWFVYWFPMTMEIHVWKTSTLVRRLDSITKDMYTINVHNSSHTTRGFKVPRHMLEDIEIPIMDILNGKA